MNRILVTGASGNIGQPLVRELKALGADFEVMTSKGGTAVAPGTRVASFEDVSALTRALEGVDTAFVLFPLVPHKIELAKHLAQAARVAGVKHLVRSSGAGADPHASYALPRLQGTIDQILQDTGITTTFLHPAGFMQNYTGFMAGMVKAGVVYGATADAPQSLIDTRDIASVAARVLTDPAAHAGKAYTLTGGEALTDTQRMAILSQLLGRPVNFVEVSVDAASASMTQSGYPPSVVEWLDSLNAVVSAGYASGISADVNHILGRAPITFGQFAHDFLESWK